MAKKTYTPEEYQAKLDKKAEKRKRFYAVFFKVFALALGCAMVYTSTVIAYKKVGTGSEATETPAGVTSTTEEEVDIDWGDDGSSDSADADDGSGSGEEAGNNGSGEGSGEGSGSANTDSSDKGLTTPKAQYDYFVKSFNNVKTKAKSVNNYWKKGSNYQSIVDAGGNALIESAGRGLMSSLLKEEEPTDAVYSGDDIKTYFPPAGATCNLKTSDIKAISCKEEGDYYIISITLKNEVDPTAGSGVGSVGSIITRQSIEEPIANVPILNSLEPSCAYENVKCEAKIEKATGNMVDYYVDLPLILTMSSSSKDYRIGLKFEERWSVEY